MEEKPDFQVGDAVRVHSKIIEGDKERIQIFEGIVIAKKGSGVSQTFTVRKIAAGGIGVERIWPVQSQNVIKVQVKKKGNVRRAKLYYLRGRQGREALRVKVEK